MDFKKPKNTLERQLYISFFSISALVLLLSLSSTLYYDISRQRQDVDTSISGAADYIAAMPDVVSMLELGYPDDSVKKDIDSFCSSIPNISVVVICDKDGLRFYHTDRQKTGDSFVGGDETAILSGSAPYITTGYGTKGTQRRAFHPVRGSDGDITGFVMASVFTAHISERQKRIILVHIAILFIMLFVCLFLTHAIVGYLKKSLMGFHPDELLNLYIRQDEVLNAVEEGLIASAPDGTILFSNIVARRIYSEDAAPLMGQPLQLLFPQTKIEQIVKTGEPAHSRACVIGSRTVLANEIPIRNSGKEPVQGILTILNDQTEMLKMSDELSGARTMLDTLRAFNHEFLNKLHIILGYLQTGETEKAIKFIVNSNLVSSQSIRQTADCIRVSRICALIIGKMMHAAELGILLTLTHDSRCMEADLILPMECYIKTIGNLLENAIEELNGDDSNIKEIHLGLYCRSDCSIITCEDTGGGINEELLEHIFENGVSSKGENRGTGLYLIRQIAEEHCGEITIDTEPGEGTCFTVTFTKKEKNSCIG